MSATVTTALYTPGAVDEAAFARFVAKTEASYRRSVAKHNARGKGLYLGWTDADCVEAARAYCGCYRHQFRVLVLVDPVTRAPVAAVG